METNTSIVETRYNLNPVRQVVPDDDLGSRIGSDETRQRTAQCIDRISRSFNDAVNRLSDLFSVDNNQKTLLLIQAHDKAQSLLSRTDPKSLNSVDSIKEQVVKKYNLDHSQTDLIKFVTEQSIVLLFFSKSLR